MQSNQINSFVVGLFILISCLLIRNETLINLPSVLYNLLFLISISLLLIDVGINYTKQSDFFRIAATILLIIFLLVGFVIGQVGQLLGSWIILASTYGKKFNDVLKIHFSANLLVCLCCVLFSLAGLIPNQMVANTTHENIGLSFASVKYTMGYFWPTDFANHVFFIILMLYYIDWVKNCIIKNLIFISVGYIVLLLTDARLGCGLIFLLSIIVTITFSLKQKKIIFYFAELIIVFSIIFTLFLVLFYDGSKVEWLIIDSILSSRLYITSTTLDLYGCSILGNKIEMVGGGTEGEYNFVDSSFWQLLIIYGYLYTTIFALLLYLSLKKTIKLKDERAAISLSLGAISAIFAQHFIQIFMNPFILYGLMKVSLNKDMILKLLLKNCLKRKQNVLSTSNRHTIL